MASNLLYIKSKILLPSNKEEQEEDPREELINQILKPNRKSSAPHWVKT